MGLLRTLILGDLGNYLDNEDTRRDVDRTRQALGQQRASQRSVDRSQNERIRALEAENDALETSFAVLSRLLVRKGVVSEAELETIVAAADDPAE